MQKIKVWDLFVRFFHWALAFTIILQLITAENFANLHAKIGYFIIILLVIRIFWGFFGTEHARFKDFIYPPDDIGNYLKGLVKGNPKHYIGHNPAGGAMACLLLIVLAFITLTGILVHNTEGKGPLPYKSVGQVAIAYADKDHDEKYEHGRESDDDDYKKKEPKGHEGSGEKDSIYKEIHETLVGFLIFLACLHICGVIASSYVHKENLVMSMITGYKKSKDFGSSV